MASTMVHQVTRREVPARVGRQYNLRIRTIHPTKTTAANSRLSLACIQNHSTKTTKAAQSKIPARALAKKPEGVQPPATRRGPVESTAVAKEQACDRKAAGAQPGMKHERSTTKATATTKAPAKPVIQDFPDVDAHDTDPQQCHEYVKDIYQFLRLSERDPCYQIKANFLGHQDEVKEYHRGVVIDWLVLVVQKFRLLQESLYLAVDIMDRYLQAVRISRADFQLLGTTALFIASKYEEIYPPSISEFAYITASTYTTRQIRELERNILKTLNYKLNKPTAIQFLRRYSKIGDADVRDHNLAKYILELSLLKENMCSIAPSEKAAAAFILARSMLRPGKTVKQLWTPTMVHYSEYEAIELHQTKRLLRSLIREFHVEKTVLSKRYTAITDKYSTKSFYEVSGLPVLQHVV